MDIEPNSTRVTLKDVAERCGYGMATVCRALQGLPGVAPKTRAAIRSVAESMGYRPDPNLSALVRYRRNTRSAPLQSNLAMLYDSTDGTNGEIPFRSHWAFQHTDERARELGFHLDCIDISQRKSDEVLDRMLQARGIRGIIIRAIEPFPTLSWHLYRTILVVPQKEASPFDCVCPDYARAVATGVRHALDLGYRRLGIALFDHQSPATDEAFRAGALLEWSKLPSRGAVGLPFYEFSTANRELLHKGYSDLMDWMQAHRPEVILSSNGLIYFWLKDGEHFDRTGLLFQIPEDVGIIGLRRWVVRGEPAYPCVDLCDDEGGSFAVNLLDQAIARGNLGIPKRPFVHLFSAPILPHPAYQAR